MILTPLNNNCIFPTRDASPPLVLAFLQAQSATTKRYQQTRHPIRGSALCLRCVPPDDAILQTDNKKKNSQCRIKKAGQ